MANHWTYLFTLNNERGSVNVWREWVMGGFYRYRAAIWPAHRESQFALRVPVVTDASMARLLRLKEAPDAS